MGHDDCFERPFHWNGPENLRAARCSWKDKFCRATSKGKINQDIWNDSRNEDLNPVVTNAPEGCHDHLLDCIRSVMKQLGMSNEDEGPVGEFHPCRKNNARHCAMGFLHAKHDSDVRNLFRLQNVPFADKCLEFARKCSYQGDVSADIHQDWSKSIKDFFFNTAATEDVLNSPASVRECKIFNKPWTLLKFRRKTND